ncbi:membrane protein [Streptomyces chrestomyceticus JCM 4735]|uniref:Membrane protein n=2 Tax=Streptomyces chrestomyceticus TaxID=68185 RepID=A0A7U9KXY2_9ACTN|nr:membrane protein [Streptomyces chrestomyceticus JCM 4735]
MATKTETADSGNDAAGGPGAEHGGPGRVGEGTARATAKARTDGSSGAGTSRKAEGASAGGAPAAGTTDPPAPPPWSARLRTTGHGDSIRMDMLFRADPETGTGTAEADTTEQPRVAAPPADREPARVTRADAAVAGIAAATDLLDTAERAVVDGALGVAAAGSRSRTEDAAAAPGGRDGDPGTGADGRPSWFRELRGGTVRPAPEDDTGPAERRGFSLSGWLALFAGFLAIACSVAFLWWRGMLPASVVRALGLEIAVRPAPHLWEWALAGLGGVVAVYAFGGLARGRVGSAWVLTLFGRYRGTVRRTGLVWISPLVLRRRVDVRLRHWRSEPMPAVDAEGIHLRVVVLVVWRVRDTARALLTVRDHTAYLREQVESGMARVLSRLPADAFHEEAPTLRDAQAVGEALTEVLAADCRPVGIEVFSVQPTRIEYAPEVAAAMQRRQIAAIDAKHRDSVLTSVVDAVDDTVRRLTSRGLVELDDYERKALVKDLTVAFYTARGSAAGKN